MNEGIKFFIIHNLKDCKDIVSMKKCIDDISK